MFSSDEDEEITNKFFFWNNWKPPSTSEDRSNPSFPIKNKYSTLQCWVPPSNFGIVRNRRQSSNNDFVGDKTDFNVTYNVTNLSSIRCEPRIDCFKSLGLVEENEEVWLLIHANIFGILRLWKNEYGNILAFGEAEFENGVKDDRGILILNKQCLLRKLLRVSVEEWSALLEALSDTTSVLTFDALNTRKDQIMSQLDKLWYFLCKRRHYLSCVYIKLRRSGVKKLTQYLKILPKFVVEEIRSYEGGEIL